jgi:drug/metabolite transporter (DMT)-like permease
MAHSEHNRPKSGGMVLIVAGILIFIFAPSYFEKNPESLEGIGAIIAGFVLGGIGFYLTFLKKKKNA